MRDYFLRRLLLVLPTLLGVTVIVFAITRMVPGGPLERAIMEAQQAPAFGRSTGQAIGEEQLQQLRQYYGLDKPLLVGYADWLAKVVRGDLGSSFRYNEPVREVIARRLPVSLYFGLVTLVLTYAVCVPLALVKAIRHRSFIDTATSVLIFVGHAVPGYALGSILLLYFSVRLDWLPMGGFVSLHHSSLGPGARLVDLLLHSVMPLFCYLIGSFALVTLLLKNQLMDNLAADYMRTAIAKGVSFRRAVTRHALRNSLIPVASTFGQNVTLLVGGSFLIETVFDIDGFGLLGVTAVLDRDYPVVMGVVLLASVLLLLGNILSDLLVTLADPRVRFD